MSVRSAGCWVLRGSLLVGILLAASPPRLSLGPDSRLALVWGPSIVAAQVPRPAPRAPDPLEHAFDLERRGSFQEAATAYRAILVTDPANENALAGLERDLTSLERLPEMLPEVRAALAARRSPPNFAVALRVWTAVGNADSVRHVAEQWAAGEGDKTIPFRTWGDLQLQRRDFGGARRAYLAGRAASGDPDALAAELAQVAQIQGDYVASAGEWIRALRLSPGYRGAAIAALVPARDKDRAAVLRALAPEQGGDGAFLAAVLLAQWGEPLRGAELLRPLLADTGARGSGEDYLVSFIAQVRPLGTREARRALGASLAFLATRPGGVAAARSRREAARADADGGDPVAAKRMLALVAGDRALVGDLANQATRTLLEVQIADGALDDAEQTFQARSSIFTVDDRATIRRRIAEGWIRRGDLGRADRLAADDSTVDGVALAGRLALYRGDLRGAKALLQQAGPYAGSREESTARIALLALIQPIEADSLPALGAALLAVERGDTLAAVAGLDRAANGLAPAKGGAALRLAAAELVWAEGANVDAERRLKEVAATAVPATAPAAELDLARLLVALGRRPEAVTQLEHLILTWPQSAFIPEARRLMDEARGGVPAT